VRYEVREAGTTIPVALPQIIFEMRDLDGPNLEVFILDEADNFCFESGGSHAVTTAGGFTNFAGLVNNPADGVQVNFSNRLEFRFQARSIGTDGIRHFKLSSTDSPTSTTPATAAATAPSTPARPVTTATGTLATAARPRVSLR